MRLERFVQDKLLTDPLWRNISVIFSGHQVPGEGEHKIMDYIRAEKVRPDYDPNTRHCLYGLDADLVCTLLLVWLFLCEFFLWGLWFFWVFVVL
jgi:5'-3' exonuclease